MRWPTLSSSHLPLLVISALVACTPRNTGPADVDAGTDVPADLGSTKDAQVADVQTADAQAADAQTADDAPDAPAVDAPDAPDPDVVAVDAPDVVTADVPPLSCRSDRDCSSRAQVCEVGLGLCVDCVSMADCPLTEVCANNRCVPPPPPCASDRECSARMQVCNVTRRACVDCNSDVDCGVGRNCNPDGNCVAQTCSPGAVSCADETTRRVCSPDGRMFTSTPCPSVTNGVSRCTDGACSPTCNAGFADCDGNAANGCEVSLGSNVSHCGACNNRCPSDGGAPGCVAGGCTLTCSAGRGDCDGSSANGCETNTASNNSHCGVCGRVCGAGQTCSSGVCAATTCPTGQSLCGGVCVDINNSVAQCGACGRACVTPGGTPACVGGNCVVAACSTGTGDCDGLAANGCETDVRSSTTHCGACGRACGAGGVCAAGTCACGPGLTLCDGRCVNLLTDNSHCAACGNACAPGTTCGGTGCVCGGGTINCDGICTDLLTNPAHCGGCGRACAAGQSCQAGACVSNPCSTGLTLCGAGNCRDLTRDAAHCGACNRACTAGQTCQSSVCVGSTLRFNLTWNVRSDLDLSVVTPTGALIYYGARSVGGGVLGEDSMTTGPEQITWSGTPASGTYYVCVIPYSLPSGPVSYTLQAFRGATLERTVSRSYSTMSASPSTERCSATSPYRVLDFVY